MLEGAQSPPRPKRWPIALLVAFVTASAGAVLALPVSDWAMQAHHVSSMEGGRACAAVGIFAPLGFFLGLTSGFFLSLAMKGSGFIGYLQRQLAALAIITTLVFALGAIGYGTADHPPTIDDKSLALEIEARVPAKGRTVEELKAQDFDLALVVSASDRNYCDMQWKAAREEGEFIVVPARAPLLSRHASREITAGIKNESRQVFNILLPPSPKKIEDAWSEWTPPRQRFDNTTPAPEDQYFVRYRVRFATEPRPSSALDSAPEEVPPNESSTPASEPSSSPDEG